MILRARNLDVAQLILVLWFHMATDGITVTWS